MDQIISQALGQVVSQLIGQAAAEIQKNPQALIEGITTLLNCGHTTEDVIQDIWDAVKGGSLSPTAALQATAILTADMERQRQRPATTPPPTDIYANALNTIRRSPEYQAMNKR